MWDSAWKRPGMRHHALLTKMTSRSRLAAASGLGREAWGVTAEWIRGLIVG